MTDTPMTGDVIGLEAKSWTGLRLNGKDLDLMRRYWQSMRVGGDVPRRSDIDPRGIQPLLENALIIERIAPGLSRLRIAGQHLSDLMGMEVRGMPLSAFITPEHRDTLAEATTELFERPALVSIALSAPGGLRKPNLKGRLMLLPLRSDLGDVSRALGCLVSQGSIGRGPRRFDIASVQTEPVDTLPDAASPQRPSGFSEPSAPYLTQPPSLSSERSYLRLVKSE